MKDVENEQYGLTDYVGKGCLYDYERHGYHFAKKSDNKSACVVGDIFKLDDKLEETLDSFYKKFGYSRTVEPVVIMPTDKNVECVIYYLEDWSDDMIPESEMEKLGSAEPFEFMKESYEMIEKDFKRFYKKNNTDIHHILSTNVNDFKRQLTSIRRDNPKTKILVSGFAIVVED